MQLARSQTLTFLRNLITNFWLQAALVFAALVLVYLYWMAIENAHLLFGLYHDDAVYMVCGQALAQGHGYRIESLPQAPFETKYPIGFCLMLAAMWPFLPAFPANLIPFHITMTAIGFLLALVSALYLVCTRKTSLLCAGVILAISLFNANYAETVPMIMSDFLCGLVMVVGVWATEAAGKRKNAGTVCGVILGILWAIPGLVRVAGVGLTLAGSIYLLLRRRYSLVWKAALVSAAICLPGIIWQFVTAPSAPDWFSFYTGYLPTKQNAHLSVWLWQFFFVGDFALNFSQLFFLMIPYLSELFKWGIVNNVVYAIFEAINLFLLVVTLAGIVRLMKRKSMLTIGGACCCIPWIIMPIHMDIRYVLPALPLVFYVILQGLRGVSRLLRKPMRRIGFPYRSFTALVAIVLGIYLVCATALSALAMFTQDKFQRETHPLFLSPQQPDSDYTYAFQWIRDHTKAGDIFACNNGPILYLYTGRRGLPPWHMDFFSGVVEHPKVPSPLEVFRFSRPAYLMDDPLYRGIGDDVPSSTGVLVIALNDVFPGSLTEVFTSPHNLVRIYQVNYDKLPENLSASPE